MKRELTPYQDEALDFKSNILLTANAGSGKTFVLSKRFVEIIINDNVELENIVAITFTDKAAGELNKRIANEIDLRIESETDEKKINKLEFVRRQLVSANISTIHSFCINILREFAPEAGIDANFSSIDQYESNELIELSIDETINRLIVNPDYEEKIKHLIRLFGSKQTLKNHLSYAIGQRKIISQHLHALYEKDESEIKKYYHDIYENHFEELFSGKIEQLLNSIKTINDFVWQKENEIPPEVSRLLKSIIPSSSLLEKLSSLNQISKMIMTGKGEVRKLKYLNKGRDYYQNDIAFIESVYDDIKEIINIDNVEETENELIRFGKTFLSIHEYSMNLYSEKKKNKGYLDYEDILLFVQNIMTLDDVRSYLRKRYKYIMIDEYQDTNEVQYKIFMPILDYLKEGNLFVVGDEKQSIYRFREADLDIFNQTKDDINNQKPSGKLLNLPHSFRMAPPLVLFTNKLFRKLFEKPQLILNEVEYNNLICAKSEEINGTIELLFADSNNYNEAELTVNKIIEIVKTKGDNNFNNIGILCRKRNFFKEIEKEFIKKNIPYSIVGGKGFYQRQTVYDIFNYLSFLLNNNDDAALIGILRSPFFSISDLELLKISRENGTSFHEKLKTYSKKESNISNIIDRLIDHQKKAKSADIYSLIRTILLESGYWTIVASKNNAKQEIANLEKLLMLARSYSQKSFKSLYDFTIELRDAIQNVEDEGQAQIAQEDNSVKILTIHQAKGLEFETVFLYGCNSQAFDDSVKTKGLSIDKNYGFLSKVPINNNYFGGYFAPPIVNLHNYINYKKNVAENKRLLYVAVTRAMNNLYIISSHKEFKIKKNSFLDLFICGLGIDLSKEELTLSEKVKFMINENGEYNFYEKDLELTIRLLKTMPEVEELTSDIVVQKEEKRILVQQIEDIPKGEIISATKISMYTQCPVKYELTYDLGYPTVFNIIKKNKNDYEYNLKEDDELKPYAATKGKIIHAILNNNVTIDNIEEEIDFYLSEVTIPKTEITNRFRTQLTNELKGYYQSKTYKEILSYKNFKNEYEVYSQEGENYLYGIIDKLVFEKDKLIIIDYKTDDIPFSSIEKRASEYKIQLKFYTYILSKLYQEYSIYELRLIFIKYPDNIVSSIISRDDLTFFKYELNQSIISILKRDYKKNLQHCSKCHFASEGNQCIKQ